MIEENTKLDKEDMDNLVAVFSLLLKWDREQNPENYKKSLTTVGKEKLKEYLIKTGQIK